MSHNIIVYIFILITQITAFKGYSEPLSDAEFYAILGCYKKDVEALTDGTEKYHFAFNNFDQAHTYKIFIDKNRLLNPWKDELEIAQKTPHLLFDVIEPGYYESMMTAFSYVPAMIGKKLSINDIELLHDYAINKIEGMDQGIAAGESHYSIKPHQNTRAALKELYDGNILFYKPFFISDLAQREIEWSNSTDLRKLYDVVYAYSRNLPTKFLSDKYLSNVNGLLPAHIDISGKRTNREDLKLRLKPIFKYYYDYIKDSKTLRGMVTAIAELLRTLEVVHFFSDANTRTYVLILTKLLIENGLPPAIVDDPGMFRLVEPIEIVADKIILGIRNFLNESPEKYRQYLSAREQNCDTDFIHAPSDYEPYYEKMSSAHGQEIKKLRKDLKKHMNEILDDSSKIPTTYDLSMAILLGSKKHIDGFLSSGARALGDTGRWLRWNDLTEVPVLLALKLNDLELANYLLEQSTKEEIDRLKKTDQAVAPLIKETLVHYSQDNEKAEAIIKNLTEIIKEKIWLSNDLISSIRAYINIDNDKKEEHAAYINNILGKRWEDRSGDIRLINSKRLEDFNQRIAEFISAGEEKISFEFFKSLFVLADDILLNIKMTPELISGYETIYKTLSERALTRKNAYGALCASIAITLLSGKQDALVRFLKSPAAEFYNEKIIGNLLRIFSNKLQQEYRIFSPEEAEALVKSGL
jgi:hypothetical protein